MDRCGEPLDGAPGGRRQLWDHRQSTRIKLAVGLASWSVWDPYWKRSTIIAACSTCALTTGREGSVPSKPNTVHFTWQKTPKTLYPFNFKLWVNVLIHSEHEAEGNKPHACGLSHFFHICILKTTFGARGLTSVSLTSVYELNGHMSSC